MLFTGSGGWVGMPETTTDADLGELCELHHFSGLGLTKTQITDKGLRTVANLRWVTLLTLNGTTVTDEGLRHLETMSNLDIVYLRNCPNITDPGVARLQKALPKCEISR